VLSHLWGSRTRSAPPTRVFSHRGVIEYRVVVSALPGLPPASEPAVVVARSFVGVQGRRTPGAAATRRFFTRALGHGLRPSEVNTDRAPAYPRVLDELLPSACHGVEQYRNNLIESDHGRLKSRLSPMRGLKRLRSAHVISAGHAFVQNIRRGHYDSAWNSTHSIDSQRPSPNSPSPSDRGTTPISRTHSPPTQQSLLAVLKTRRAGHH
jgi:hypothetical protein